MAVSWISGVSMLRTHTSAVPMNTPRTRAIPSVRRIALSANTRMIVPSPTAAVVRSQLPGWSRMPAALSTLLLNWVGL